MLKFYHKAGCPVCRVAQLKLNAKKIEYEDILIDPLDENDKEAIRLMNLGVKGAPVLEFEDGHLIIGAEVSKWVNLQEARDEN